MTAREPTPDLVWTSHEVMLWETARIVGKMLRGQALTGMPSDFALQLSHDGSESLLASAPYGSFWFGSLTDGSYQKNTFFVGGFGLLGIGLGALTLGLSAVGNDRRRAQAAVDGSRIWRPLTSGVVHVSSHGFYLDNENGISSFSFGAVQRVELIGIGEIQWWALMADNSTQLLRLHSDCAELIFALWALRCCPGHPQFRSLVWLPEPFLERVAWAGLNNELFGRMIPTLGRGR